VDAAHAKHQRRSGTENNGMAQLKSIPRIAGLALVALVVFGMAVWGALAIHYSIIPSTALRNALAAAFALSGLVALVALWARRWRWRVLGTFALISVVLLAWWSRIEPSNDRDWKPEAAVLPYVTFNNDEFTVHNIRNFSYRTETDFTPAYYDQTFDVRELESLDVIASYWAGPDIAHIFLSFGFGGDEHLAVSIERRDERGEGYSTVKGLFRQYELMYVVADERDVIRLRTNVRRDPPEDVYLFTLHGRVENARLLLLEYLRKINELHERPEFYNTLTTNCTSNIWLHARVNPGRAPYSWKILLSGHVPEYLYELGRLDTRLPFAELKRRSQINAAARAADDAEDFSTRIRVGLPEVERPASASGTQ
jgi:hypothetical protein